MKIKDYLKDIVRCAEHLQLQSSTIDEIIKMLLECRESEHKVFICGNGGSAGTATHMAGDLFKIAGIKAISLDDNVPLMTAIINDNGWENLYVDQLKRLMNHGDILVAISVHGGSGKDKAGKWSQNLMKAIQYSNENLGKTVGFSGFDGGAMKKECDVCIVVPSNSTPVVESFHVVLEHLITFALQEGDRK